MQFLKPLSALYLVLVASVPMAAESEPLVTDRPDFTESAVSVQPGRVQVELGVTAEQSGEVDSQSFGEILVRIGLSDAIELRLGANSYVRETSSAEEADGLENSSIGIKIELVHGGDEPQARKPAAALLIATTLPTGSPAVRQPHLEPGVVLAVEWSLGSRSAIASNVGVVYASDDDDQFLAGSLSVALSTDLGRGFGGYVEYFNLVPESSGPDDRHFLNAGFTYLISDDFQLDIRGGSEVGGEMGSKADYFAGIGLAYRF